MQSQALNVPGVGGTINTAFAYDNVNRLMVAAEFSPGVTPSSACPNSSSLWCRQYSYNSPGHGNRQTSAWSGQGLSLLEPSSFNANNQITTSGWNYMEANNLQRGNVTQTPGGATMTYDAENRQIAYNSSGQTT